MGRKASLYSNLSSNQNPMQSPMNQKSTGGDTKVLNQINNNDSQFGSDDSYDEEIFDQSGDSRHWKVEFKKNFNEGQLQRTSTLGLVTNLNYANMILIGLAHTFNENSSI